MSFEWLMLILGAVICINYMILILTFAYGFKKLTVPVSQDSTVLVSVIVAARNEENTILSCLKSLVNQDYPAHLMEIIIIDDQSTDATAGIIQSFIKNHTLHRIRLLTSEGSGGKKSAIQQGVQVAGGSFILTTDADCIHSRRWVDSMVQCHIDTEALLVAGPVMMQQKGGFFNAFQCVEFNSLIASTAGSMGVGRPFMCNGANMGFTAEARAMSGRDALKLSQASGDDVFLLFSIKKQFGAHRISFAKTPDALVYTGAADSIKGFINQRLRWVSKSRDYKDRSAIYTAVSVFGLNALIVILLVGSIFNSSLLLPALVAFMVKVVVDGIILTAYSRLFGQGKLLWYLPVIEIPVILYTVMLGIAGNLFSYKWKGRTHKQL